MSRHTYASSSATILVGDCLDRLREIPDGSVRTCVTSPPYFGLRDYQTAQWLDGDPACDHFKLAGGTGAQSLGKSAASSAANVERSSVPFRDRCGKCGATRIDSQIGLEPTPAAYVAQLVAVFRDVRRVLADDGTMFLNLGDSYAGSCMTGGTNSIDGSPGRVAGMFAATRPGDPDKNGGVSNRDGLGRVAGLKPKDLIGAPWLVAFALRADGWYLRSEIIWAKPNPMPESVTDRPTKSHEQLFLLAKGQRYYYDADEIAEPEVSTGPRVDKRIHNPALGRMDAGIWHGRAGQRGNGMRNRRSVWTIASQPYSGAHFAVMPRALVEPCVLAGSAPGDLVLDPFAGAGTTGLVALGLGRRFVGVELNPKYAAMAWERIRDVRASADEQIERERVREEPPVDDDPDDDITFGYAPGELAL